MWLKAESLIAPLLESPGELSRYERCKLDFVMGGNVRDKYEAVRCMTQEAPGSDAARGELVLFLIRLNRPAEAIQIMRERDPDRGHNKQQGFGYWSTLSDAYHMLGDHERELEAARRGRERFPQSWSMLRHEAFALAGLGRLDDVAAVLEATRSLPPPQNLGWLFHDVAEELRVHGHRDKAREVLDEAIAWFQSRPNDTEGLRAGLGWALYGAERWDDAQRLFEGLAEEHPENTEYLVALGVLAARRGDREEAARISEELRSSSNPLVARQHRRYRAMIAAVLGEREEAMTLLQEYFDMGLAVGWIRWVHRNIDFEPLHDYPPFQEFMRPKG
jgi:tetratricopeptide (TPR) repeat protein